MNCLSPEQIARQALGREDDAGPLAHAQQCGECRARLAHARTLSAQLGEMHAQFDRGHDAARGQLMTALSAIDRPKPARAPLGITLWLGGLTMRQRIAAGSFCAAALLVVVWVWSGGATKHASAMERMAEEIRRAKSYQVTMDTEVQFVSKPGETVTQKATSKFFWLAPRSYRTETVERVKVAGDQFMERRVETDVSPTGKPGIHVDHKLKKFSHTPAHEGYISGLEIIDKLSDFSGQADRDLGTKEINGKRARGFEIDARKIEPASAPGPVQVWIDNETNLPVLFRMEMAMSGMPASMTWRDFQWNNELDPKLFDPTPPEGYTDKTSPPPSLEKQVRVLTEGFKTYAELSGGHYPRGKMVYGDVTLDEMLKMSGINGQPTEEQRRSDAYRKIERVFNFCPTINGILRDNPDAAYYGKTVGPKDSGQVLLRWRLDDGRYQVIFGDLRAEIVTAQRLRTLEAE